MCDCLQTVFAQSPGVFVAGSPRLFSGCAVVPLGMIAVFDVSVLGFMLTLFWFPRVEWGDLGREVSELAVVQLYVVVTCVCMYRGGGGVMLQQVVHV